MNSTLANRGWRNQGEHQFYVGRQARPCKLQASPCAVACPHQPQQLERAGHGNGNGLGNRRFNFAVTTEENQRDNHADIQQYRRGGIDPETVQRIQYAAKQRHQRDKREIGKGDNREMACERKFLRPAIGEAASHGPDNRTRRQHHEPREQHQKWKQQRQHLARECARSVEACLCLFAFRLGHFLVEQRDKNRRECAFSEQCTEQVGQPPRNQECVGRKACTDVACHQHIAQ